MIGLGFNFQFSCGMRNGHKYVVTDIFIWINIEFQDIFPIYKWMYQVHLSCEHMHLNANEKYSNFKCL